METEERLQQIQKRGVNEAGKKAPIEKGIRMKEASTKAEERHQWKKMLRERKGVKRKRHPRRKQEAKDV